MEFKAILVYRVGSRVARAVPKRNPVSKKTQKPNKTNDKETKYKNKTRKQTTQTDEECCITASF